MMTVATQIGVMSAPDIGHRARRAAIAVVLSLGVFLGWQGRSAPLTVNGDDATYVTLSQSLEHGRYHDEFLVGTPPHAQYPPGMPAWLLVVRQVTGSKLAVPQFASFLLLALIAFLVADALRLLGMPWLGVTVSAAVMFNPGLVWVSSALMSETLYTAGSTLALYLALRDELRPTRAGPVLALTTAIGAFLTRSIGLAMIGAVIGTFAIRRRKTAFLVGGLVSLLVIAGWFAYTAWATRHTATGHTYAADFAVLSNRGHLGAIMARAFTNVRWYASRLPQEVFGVPDIPGTALDTWLEAGVMIATMLAGLAQLWRPWPSAVLSLFFSAAIMLVFWPFLRLSVPLVPVLITAMALGLVWTGRQLGLARPAAAAVVLTLALAMLGVQREITSALRASSCRASAEYIDARCYDQEVRNLMAAAQFLRDSVAGPEIVASSKPATLFQVSAHQGLHLESVLRQDLRHVLRPEGPVSYILLTHLRSFEPGEVTDSLVPLCRRLSPIRSYLPDALLLAVRDTGVSINACDALATFRAGAGGHATP